jgi:hypothetical protein
MNDLPSVVKKKVAVTTTGLALHLEVPTMAAASIRGWKVGRSTGTLVWMAD